MSNLDFQLLFESAPDLYLVLQPDLKIVAVSNAYASATMTKRDEIIGKGLFEVFPDNPDDPKADGVSRLQASLNQVLKHKISHTMELQKYDIRRPDGTFEERYWSPLNTPVLNDKKEVKYIIHCVEDVTVRKKAEEDLKKSNELFSNLFKHNPASIVISRLSDAHIINVNEAFLSFFGFDSKEQVLGKTARELNIVAHPEQREELAELLKTNKIVKDFEIQTYAKDGKVFWISTSILIIDIENTPCLFSISVDISNRKKAEEQLQSVNKELEAFSYSVSHDLRAPLRAVNGYAQMLKEEYNSKLDDEGKRIVEVIKFNATKMGTLIDELLAFSRLGRKEIQKTNIQMDKLTGEVLAELNKLIPHQAEIKIGKLHDIKADPILLRQVMFNLISNAVKYSSKKKEPVVEIFSEQKNREIIFSVKDNGAGFDMRYANKLFGVFQRLHSQDEFEGTGVGLAIIQRIIAKHGGRIWAEGKVNAGAIFNFSLTNN